MFIIIPTENLNTSCDFNSRCMRRVYSAYYLKKILNPITLEIFGLLALTGAGAFFVSLKSILKNSPEILNLQNAANFWLGAFLNTEWSNKAIFSGAILILGVLIFQTLRFLIPIVRTVSKNSLRWVRLIRLRQAA